VSEPPFILFVVPTFNRARDLPRTLGAIAAQDWPADRMSILVVDNASTDDTPDVLATLARELPCGLEHLRKAPEGPTVARNIGLQRGIGGFVALVDSDVALASGWARATAAALTADPSLAQVAGKLVFAHDPTILNSYGGAIGPLGLAWDRHEGEAADQVTEPADVPWINTAAVLVRPDPALAVGGFDAAFFYGYEEPDFGLRLAIAGWRSRVIPDAVAVHHTGTEIGPSSPEIVFHYTKNRIRMGIKVLGPARLTAFLAANLAYGILDALLHRPRAARWRALWWNLAHASDTWVRRRTAQSQRRASDRIALACVSASLFPPNRLRGLRRRPVHGATVTAAGADDRVPTAPALR